MKEELKHRRKKNNNRRFFLLATVFLIVAGAALGAGWYFVHLDTLLDRRFARAEELLLQRDYDGAAKVFLALGRNHPDFPRAAEALLQAGEISQVHLENDQQALLAYLTLLRDHGENSLADQAQRQVADLYMERLGDYPSAIVAYQKLLDRGVAEGDRVQYRIGEAYFRLNNFEQARIEWETLLKNHPGSPLAPEATYRSAVTWSLQGEFAAARETFAKVVATWPDHPYALEARFGQATILEEQERLGEALEILQSLQESYPKPEVLQQRIDQVKERIAKKKKAI